MSRGRAFIDRLVTFLLFLVAGVLAFWGIGLHFNVPAAERLGGYSRRDFWAELTGQDDYSTVLIVAAVVLGLVGLLLIGVNVERRRLGRSASPASAPGGTVRTSPADLASAVAQTFEKRDDVRSASYRATRDRGTPLIEIRLRVPAETDITDLHDACRRASEDILAALPGQGVLPRFLLQTDQPARDH